MPSEFSYLRYYAIRTKASAVDSEYATLMSATTEVFVHEHNTASNGRRPTAFIITVHATRTIVRFSGLTRK